MKSLNFDQRLTNVVVVTLIHRCHRGADCYLFQAYKGCSVRPNSPGIKAKQPGCEQQC